MPVVIDGDEYDEDDVRHLIDCQDRLRLIDQLADSYKSPITISYSTPSWGCSCMCCRNAFIKDKDGNILEEFGDSLIPIDNS